MMRYLRRHFLRLPALFDLQHGNILNSIEFDMQLWRELKWLE